MSVGSMQLTQRYELAAALCAGKRVLDVGPAPDNAREPLAVRAAELVSWDPDSAPQGHFDTVISLAGEPDEAALAELERRANQGARVLAAFERVGGARRSPRAEPPAEDAARGLAERLSASVVLPQFAMEGSMIGRLEEPPQVELHTDGTRDEDAAALIVVSGFDRDELDGAMAGLRVSAAPALLTYVRGLEAAHADLLRANRQLTRERIGRDGSAASSLLNAQRELETMRAIARGHEEQAQRVAAWYDAPRYHLVDRIRTGMTKIPGLTGLIRFLWSLISTRAESPQLDAAANPPSDEPKGVDQITREREGLSEEEQAAEPVEVTSRLED